MSCGVSVYSQIGRIQAGQNAMTLARLQVGDSMLVGKLDADYNA